MNDDIRLRMQKIPGLFADGFHDLGVAMTGIGDADAAGEVKEPASIIGVDIGTFGAIGNKVKYATPNRSHVLNIFRVEGVCGHDSFPLIDIRYS
jgi:hypothetical protein